MDWQPIESAPKDGTKILAIENFTYEWEDENGVAKTRPGDWCVVSWHPQHEEWIGFGMMLSSFTPTHWMPLPEPPK